MIMHDIAAQPARQVCIAHWGQAGRISQTWHRSIPGLNQLSVVSPELPYYHQVEFKNGFLLLCRNALIIGSDVEIRIGKRMAPCLT